MKEHHDTPISRTPRKRKNVQPLELTVVLEDDEKTGGSIHTELRGVSEVADE
jgi:hypothetical protein